MRGASSGRFNSKWLETRKRDHIKNCVIQKTNAAIEKTFIQEKWPEEIRYFLLDHLRPALSREELDFLRENFAALALAVERALEAAMNAPR